MRTETPRAAAPRRAPATTAPAGSGRRTSYRASSSERRAPARKAATSRATSSGVWPRGVSVWSRIAIGRRHPTSPCVSHTACAGATMRWGPTSASLERRMKHTAHGWWLEEAGPARPAPALDGEQTADLAIVGGGYTGMWTAWHALAAEPGMRVTILEADRCGHGPSGRNGGFCESLWVAIARLREEVGDAAALALAGASSESVGAIGRWCEEEGVDAWFRRAPYLLTATSDATEGAGLAAAEAAAALGAAERVRCVDADEVRARCASPHFRGGILIADSATVQP